MLSWFVHGHSHAGHADAHRRSAHTGVLALRALVTVALGSGVLALALSGARPTLAAPGVFAPLASPDDWSTYLHDPQRTAASRETILSPANAGQLTKLWSFKTGGVVAASATVVGGVVYVGSWDGYEYALDAATGALRWKTFLGLTTVPGCNPSTAGVSSAAAVQDGVVYVGGGDAYWYALDASSGAILWQVFTGDNSATGGHYNWASPLLYQGDAYIGVASLGDCPLVQGQLLQVSLSTHQVVHTFDVVPTGQVGGGIWTSPTVDPASNTIFVTTGTETSPTQPDAQALLALDATTLTLKAAWKLPEAQTVPDSDWGTTPTLLRDAAGTPLVVATNKNGVAYAFNRTNLAAGPVWQQAIAIGGSCPQCGDGSLSSGAFANGTLYLAGGNTIIGGTGYPGSVRALDPATGHVVWERGAAGAVIAALAYSNGLLIDSAGAVLEVRRAATGARLYTFQTPGLLYAAPSVSRGEIFAGGTDGTVYAFGLRTGTPYGPPVAPGCPAGWDCQDVGAATPVGTQSTASPTWSITAGGTGVGGTADQFHLVAPLMSGDVQLVAQVSPPQTGAAAQAGLMIRQSVDPNSPYYALFVTPSNGVIAQYRTAFGGGTIVTQRLSGLNGPVYLEIQRRGDRLQAATSGDGVTFTLVAGTTVVMVLPATVLAGLAVSSGSNGTRTTALFGGVAVGAPTNTPAPAPPASPCPAGWSCADVGNPALVGDQALSGGVWTLTGAGNDIWDRYDQFHYVWQMLAGDGSLSAHLTSQTNTDAWAKAGLMLRQSTDASAAFYAVYVTPANGIVVQYRAYPGLGATEAVAIAGAAPAYVRIGRAGATYTAYTSSDGTHWAVIAGSAVTLSGLSGALLAGMAVTSHNGGALSAVTFDTVTLAAMATAASTPPAPREVFLRGPSARQALAEGLRDEQ